ncbi:MAG: IS200/IS605 family transposase [Fusobacteriaceae bacterium]
MSLTHPKVALIILDCSLLGYILNLKAKLYFFIVNTSSKLKLCGIIISYFILVVIIKYRRKCINNGILEDLKEISKRLLSVKGDIVLEVTGEEDHLHILFECLPQVELAKLVNTFKTVSSRLIRKKYSDYLRTYYWKPVFWSNSYSY